ncbi:LuxR family transcriptional regulator [Frankia sp. QA3]|uniref:helix-turn-helix transcriptional regulator n=1 Tax=Frankia sp. QA3 TaxID=710111 RepID=UPI000269C157|nr:LuxR family transcriptional regulator [Frankia sp. QA3]EIV91639.1 transcriptional regulator, luxR family [Frankia sp. QA3]
MSTAATAIAGMTATGPHGTVRTAEHARIMTFLDARGEGRTSLVELTGDPGYGKTRLLTAVAGEARRRGVDVLRARCTETRTGESFHPFIEAFTSWRPSGTTLLAPATAFIRALAAAADMLDDTSTSRCRLFAELRSLYGDCLAAAPGGLLLLFDDFHFADRASVDLLEVLARWPLVEALPVVVAHRQRQVPAWMHVTIQAGVELGAVEQIRLAALTLQQSAELLGLPGRAPGLADLHERGAGNPLYLTALAEQEAGGGDDGRADGFGHAPSAGPSDHWARTTLGVRLLAETTPLGATQRLVARAAAVLGDTFTVDAVAAVAQLDRAEACRALRELRARDLVRATPGGELAFRHPLVGRCLYGQTDPCWQVGAHRRALEYLRTGPAAPTLPARHAERSGPRGPAGVGVGLTAREREVARLAAQGLRTRDIAGRLRVSPRTVDTHLAHIYGKLGVSSRVELVRLLSVAP